MKVAPHLPPARCLPLQVSILGRREPRPGSPIRAKELHVVRWNPGRSRLDRRARGGLRNICRARLRARSDRRGASRRISVRGERDERLANARGRLRDGELWGSMPAVGDWVAVCDAAGGGAAIEAVLPRHSKVSRKTPWLKAEEHILVANVDTVLLVSGLDGDFNPRRIERYLVAAWDSGADPVLVLTKLDVCDDLEKLAEAEAVAIGVPVHAVSNLTGRGSTSCARCSGPHAPSSCSARRASASRRSSTACRAQADAHRDLRRDGRGRHTTRHRQLLVLPGGALFVDTPGLRELQVWEGDVDSAFSDLAELQALAASTTAATRRSRTARCRRRSPAERSIPSVSRASASCSASCARSRSARASGCSGRPSSAGDSGHARAELPVGTARGCRGEACLAPTATS